MNKFYKPPVSKVKRLNYLNRQDSPSPLKKSSVIQGQYVIKSSTPVPGRSPSPVRENQGLASKGSLGKLPFKKVDLRKGIFSSKQNFVRDLSEKNIERTGESPVPSQRGNKYLKLSKEFKIDKKLMHPKRINFEDAEILSYLENPKKSC